MNGPDQTYGGERKRERSRDHVAPKPHSQCGCPSGFASNYETTTPFDVTIGSDPRLD